METAELVGAEYYNLNNRSLGPVQGMCDFSNFGSARANVQGSIRVEF